MHGPQAIVSFWLHISTLPSRNSHGRQRTTPFSVNSACAKAGWLSRHRGVRLRANRLPVEGLAALAAFTATFTVSLLLGPAY